MLSPYPHCPPTPGPPTTPPPEPKPLVGEARQYLWQQHQSYTCNCSPSGSKPMAAWLLSGRPKAAATAFSSSLLATPSSPSRSLLPFASCRLYVRVAVPVWAATNACIRSLLQQTSRASKSHGLAWFEVASCNVCKDSEPVLQQCCIAAFARQPMQHTYMLHTSVHVISSCRVRRSLAVIQSFLQMQAAGRLLACLVQKHETIQS